MKNTLFCLFIFCSVSTFAQNGITFKVEKLSKPEELLHLHSPNEIYESLILSDMNIEPYEIKEKNIKVPYHIIAKSESPDSLVSFGPNSFFQWYVSGLCGSQAIRIVSGHDLAINQPGICTAYQCQSGIYEK